MASVIKYFSMRARQISTQNYVYWRALNAPDNVALQAPVASSDLEEIVFLGPVFETFNAGGTSFAIDNFSEV